MFETNSNYEMLTPAEEMPSLEYIIQHPESVFSSSLKINPKQAYQSHRVIRNALAQKSNYLGIGSVGYVFSGISAESGTQCRKIVWDRLSVHPNKGLQFGQLKYYGDEIERLYQIQESFRYTREAIRNSLNENRVTLPNNKLLLEAALQVYARKSITNSGIGCHIPEVQHFFTYDIEDMEHDYNDYSYFLDEKYSTITMEQVRGKSIEDLIEGYPENLNILGSIDFDLFKENATKAINLLNDSGLVHGDITPRNIMINFDDMLPTIIDFGKSGLSSNLSEIDDEKDLKQVLNHLASYLKDPLKKHEEFMTLKKERERKAGFIFG